MTYSTNDDNHKLTSNIISNSLELTIAQSLTPLATNQTALRTPSAAKVHPAHSATAQSTSKRQHWSPVCAQHLSMCVFCVQQLSVCVLCAAIAHVCACAAFSDVTVSLSPPSHSHCRTLTYSPTHYLNFALSLPHCCLAVSRR